MLLKNKTAVIYGVADSLAGETAKAFAKQGARVFMTGRTYDKVKTIADEVIKAGGQAEAAQVDALDENAIEEHLDSVVKKTGAIDISFNGINVQDTQNVSLINMSLADFIRPIDVAMQTQFLTATAAGRRMAKQGSGVILSLSSTPAVLAYPLVGGFGPACCAIEGFSRNLATELGPYGVRVVGIRSAGSPDSRPFREARQQGGEEVEHFIRKLEEDTMLKRLPMMEDIANAAVFLSSYMAGKITGVTLDVTVGTTTGLNYKVAFIPFLPTA